MSVIRNLPAFSYAALIYGFIFLPVCVLVLFSFQESRVPIPPFTGPSLKWWNGCSPLPKGCYSFSA